MMRAMRSITKPVFWVVAITFIGWMAYGQVQDLLAGGKDVVLKVDGTVIRQQPFQAQYQATLEQYRRQQGGGRLSREDEQQIQNRVADQFIQNILLDRAYRRLGIGVSDQEIIEAARSSPPPQILDQVMQDATFQTDGRFDITKWQRYLSTAGPEFQTQVEQLYREYLPQRKLQDYLTADVYVSDAKLWRIWRDQHESVTVALLAIRPEDIPDSLAPVPEAELQRYYDGHKSEFTRPGTAWLSYIQLPRIPNAADSASARAHVHALRADIVGGKTKFEDAAKKESSDSGSAARGGDLGWVKRDAPGFVAPFAAALRHVTPGVVSEPVLTEFGYHLIRIDAVKGDSVHVRHILIPVALQGTHLDAVDARTDTLDRMAAEQSIGAKLDSAARALHLPLAHTPRLTQGQGLSLNGRPVPDVSVWAFEGRVPGETSPVIDGDRASYVFRLDSVQAEGVPPLDQVRAAVAAGVRYEKKKAIARTQAEQVAAKLRNASDLLTAGRAIGYPVERLGPFTRVTAPSNFLRNPTALGAAFGLRPGEKSGVVSGEAGSFLLQVLAHQNADSSAWFKQRAQQREALMQPLVKARVQQYLTALRADAKIVDRRNEIYRSTVSSGS